MTGEAKTGDGVGGRLLPSPVASPSGSPWSRILQPGRTCCDAFPQCRYVDDGETLRDHMRECPDSPAGQLYRVLVLVRPEAREG